MKSMAVEKKEIDLTSVAQLYPPQGQWTEEDYLFLPDTNRYVELSEGKLIMPPHPGNRHQAVLMEIAFRFRNFAQEKDVGTVRIAPLPVRLWPGKIREPDILLVTKEHRDRIGEQVYGVPDLVVEILSPGTEHVDRGEKYFEYAKAGVREYWIVDPDEKKIEVYVEKRGVYQLFEKYGPGQTAYSKILPGFKIDLDEIL